MTRYYLDYAHSEGFSQEEFEIRLSIAPNESHNVGTADFVFDTGSPLTIIGTEFADRLDLPMSRFSFNDGTGYIAGAKLDLEKLNPCTFGMKGDQGNATSGQFAFHVPDYDGIPHREVDNILGMDFAIQLGFDFHFLVDEDGDPTAYFED